MIFGKTIVESKGRTYINFNLMDISDNQNINAGLGEITLTGYAPTVAVT